MGVVVIRDLQFVSTHVIGSSHTGKKKLRFREVTLKRKGTPIQFRTRLIVRRGWKWGTWIEIVLLIGGTFMAKQDRHTIVRAKISDMGSRVTSLVQHLAKGTLGEMRRSSLWSHFSDRYH